MTKMHSDAWNMLFELESQDLVKKRFQRIHGRALNSRRANEITSSSIQAREFFYNARQASYSVKPLLLFYGVASLSRALALLLSESGEEALKQGHGLETVQWRSLLGTNVAQGLSHIGQLRIKTCNGFFRDVLSSTENCTYLHIRSSAVGWSLRYDLPKEEIEITLLDILERLPDLEHEYTTWVDCSPLFFYIDEINMSQEKNEISLRITDRYSRNIHSIFPNWGIELIDGTTAHMTAPINLLENKPPIFINSYINRSFGTIPNFFLTPPFGDICLSQIAISYALSFFTGMLCRYFPTHWVGLIRGAQGDAVWPTIHKSLLYIEVAFPELVWEFIESWTKDSKQQSA